MTISIFDTLTEASTVSVDAHTADTGGIWGAVTPVLNFDVIGGAGYAQSNYKGVQLIRSTHSAVLPASEGIVEATVKYPVLDANLRMYAGLVEETGLNGYLAMVTGAGKVTLYKLAAGALNLLVTGSDAVFLANTDVKITLEVTGTSFRILVNDVERVPASVDATYIDLTHIYMGVFNNTASAANGVKVNSIGWGALANPAVQDYVEGGEVHTSTATNTDPNMFAVQDFIEGGEVHTSTAVVSAPETHNFSMTLVYNGMPVTGVVPQLTLHRLDDNYILDHVTKLFMDSSTPALPDLELAMVEDTTGYADGDYVAPPVTVGMFNDGYYKARAKVFYTPPGETGRWIIKTVEFYVAGGTIINDWYYTRQRIVAMDARLEKLEAAKFNDSGIDDVTGIEIFIDDAGSRIGRVQYFNTADGTGAYNPNQPIKSKRKLSLW